MPALKQISTQRLIILLALTGLVLVLGYQFLKTRPRDRVQAVGNLTFTFNGLPPEAPVFLVDDLKPGDCYSRPVTAQNDGQNSAMIAVRSENINNPDDLSSTLFIDIVENATTLYGGAADPKTLNQFFTDSTTTLEGLPLSSLAANTATTYQFTVCMPPEAGNEWQKTQLVFDLSFGNNAGPTPTPSVSPTITPTPIPLPPECEALVGKIQNVFYGTENGEYIHGSIYNDLIYGYGGNDILDASGGDDCVIGGDGDDYIRTEDGNDIIIGGLGNDRLKSGSGDDVVYGNEGNDTIDAGSGTDIVHGGPGDDTIDAGDNDDTVYGETGADTIKGKGGSDTLYGGPDNDELDGGSGPDHLYGDDGDDILEGGSGNDSLDGGPDTDELDGESGTNTCINGEVVSACTIP